MDLSVGATDERDRPLPVAGFKGTPEKIERFVTPRVAAEKINEYVERSLMLVTNDRQTCR
jgi:hypothetical protein